MIYADLIFHEESKEIKTCHIRFFGEKKKSGLCANKFEDYQHKNFKEKNYYFMCVNALQYLAELGFTPVSETFFYKK